MQKWQDYIDENGTGSDLAQYRTSDETVAKRKRQKEDEDRHTKTLEDRQIDTLQLHDHTSLLGRWGRGEKQ